MRKILFSVFAVYAISTSFQSSHHTHLKPDKPIAQTAVAPKPEASAKLIYQSIDFDGYESISEDAFEKALTGFENLKRAGKLDAYTHLLTVADFSLSSTKNRLWVIDLNARKVLFNTLVSHGRGTGDEFAVNFSNKNNSHQSSLGFYITESTYNGSNGYSLRLHGMDKGYNDAAYERAIVMHGADYVSESFAKAQNRIGRSWGCPAVSREMAAPIINTIKGKNLLFIYYPDREYLASSEWLKDDANVGRSFAKN